jgi:hypothetical protein
VDTRASLLGTSPVPQHLETARRPVGLNGVFVEFQGRKWFAAGPAIEYEPDAFATIGESQGFPVYQRRGDARVIYVPATSDSPALVVPYGVR